jgi:hypothetical protein
LSKYCRWACQALAACRWYRRTPRTWSINLSLGFGWNFGLFSMFAIKIA